MLCIDIAKGELKGCGRGRQKSCYFLPRLDRIHRSGESERREKEALARSRACLPKRRRPVCIPAAAAGMMSFAGLSPIIRIWEG